MPNKLSANPDKIKSWNANWHAVRMQRRKDWLNEHGPCVRCGSWERLEIDHIDPALKIESWVFGWTKERQDVELATCQVLCHSCHLKKTLVDLGKKSAVDTHGTLSSYKWCGPPKCTLCKKAKSEFARLHPSPSTIAKKQSIKQQTSARGTHGTHAAYKYCGPPKCNACKVAHTEHCRKYKSSV